MKNVLDFLSQVRDSIRSSPAAWIRAGLLLLPLLVMYADTMWRLAGDWWNDPNNSHGLLIPPLAAYFAWQKRRRFEELPENPATAMGIVTVIGSLLVYFVGRLGAEFFLTRVSAIGLGAGMLLFFFGWKQLKVMAFPLGFLLLAVPIPTIVFNTISIPLQSIASDWSANVLNFCEVPVLQEGNVLQLASTSLGVAEACSGLRSLVSLIALAVILGYMRWNRLGQRFLLIFLSVPVALALNVFRISMTGVIAENWSVKYAMGFFHEFSGWVVFLLAFAILYGISALIQKFWPCPPPEWDQPTRAGDHPAEVTA